MRSRFLHFPVVGIVLFIFMILIVIMLPFLLLGIIGGTLSHFGLSGNLFLLFLLVSLVGSAVNIPFGHIASNRPSVSVRYIHYIGIPYPVPTIETKPSETILSINFGGALMPLFLSAYLLLANQNAVLPSLMAIPLVAVVVFLIARPVKGLGIVTPMFIPPLISAFAAILLGGSFAPVVAYVGGTLGTLIGADLLHLNSVKSLGAASVSIGGAGTFDGVFLTGLLAVLLAF